MKNYALRIVFTLLLVGAAMQVSSQTVRGSVLDSDTSEPIPFANVYFNSSQRGTTSDLDGQFELNIKDYENQDIVVSCVGYSSRLIIAFEEGKFYKVLLEPRSNLLREVVVVADDIPRKRKEEIFKREFIGTSANASKCVIQNLDDVVLTYFKSTKTLQAYCPEPMIIFNKPLGYKIRYFLDEFSKSQDSVYYSGYFLFEDDTTLSINEMKDVVKRRKRAYYGSRMHFFREMFRASTYKLEFVLLDYFNDQMITLSKLITEANGNVRHLRPIGPIKIIYKNDVSVIEFKGDECVPFTNSGFFDSRYLWWRGDMSDQRIAELLPFEYWP